MKWSVGKRADKKAVSKTTYIGTYNYLSLLLICSPLLHFLLIMPYSYLHICIYLRTICALVCVWGGGGGVQDFILFVCLAIYTVI